VRRKIIFGSVILLLFITIWQFELLSYGLSQGYGQLSIIWKAKPIEEVYKDPAFPDSLKAKLKLIQEIKQFAFDSLGIKYSENYSSIYDQKGKPLLWTVTACEPFQLKAHEWKFPLIGNFSYKGFFNYEQAVVEENIIRKEGFDTSIDEVAGWSTLGWFNDPVLSDMLNRSPGSLANLIIHELTHGTLYVKDNVDFNENLASFVGDRGAQMFLDHKYGEDSKEFLLYKKGRIVSEQYTALVLSSAKRLDSLYNSFTKGLAVKDKMAKKKTLMDNIIADLTNFSGYSGKKNIRFQEELQKINNTYFMDFKRYRKDQSFFEKEFITKFKSDFRSYLAYLKDKYPSI
jgi:predicted aminopeptidase